MGAVVSAFSSSSPAPDLTQQYVDPTPDVPFRFLDLPAELRTMVYHLIVADTIYLELEARVDAEFSEDWRDHGLKAYQFEGPDHAENIKTAVTLMKTCYITHTEMADCTVCQSSSRSAFHWPRCLWRTCCHRRVTLFELSAFSNIDPAKLGEGEEVNMIRSMVVNLTGLRELRLEQLDRSADAQTKGTVWKPRELRKLAVALKESAHLREAFYEPPDDDSGWQVDVRLTTADGVADLAVGILLN